MLQSAEIIRQKFIFGFWWLGLYSHRQECITTNCVYLKPYIYFVSLQKLLHFFFTTYLSPKLVTLIPRFKEVTLPTLQCQNNITLSKTSYFFYYFLYSFILRLSLLSLWLLYGIILFNKYCNFLCKCMLSP